MLAHEFGLQENFEPNIKRAVRTGQMPKGISPRAGAIGLLALFDGLLLNWMLDRANFNLLRVGGQVFDAYVRGLTTSA